MLGRDVPAALAVGILAVPQGVAYAMVAGLPPAMGLYASAAPAVVGSLLRASRHVVTGPTNALSLLVGGTVVASADDPVAAAVTLAFLVGVTQALAGALRLGAVVDYISSPVVLGYITGASVLIAAGQLPNITGTAKVAGTLPVQLWGWGAGLVAEPVSLWSVGVALGTAAVLVVVGRLAPRAPGGMLALVAGIVLSLALDLRGHGVRTIADIASIPSGLPPLTLPDLSLAVSLWPAAVACTVLSLTESSAVARAMAQRTGQHLDPSVEFWGQGMANLASSLTGGYPISGSPVRSTLNVQSGAQSRLSGVLSGGVVLLAILLLGPLLDATPVPSLAGLLVVVAAGLVDWRRIRRILRVRSSDTAAFLVTLVGSWLLSLDQAIYRGVGISLVLFLRRARLLIVREMGVGSRGRLRDFPLGRPPRGVRRCSLVRILHVEGTLFFGSAGELRTALEEAAVPGVAALVVRLKRTQGMDATTIEALDAAAAVLQERGVRLVLVGLREGALERLRRLHAGDVELLTVFPSQSRWFGAMNEALAEVAAQVHLPPDSPVRSYLERLPAPQDAIGEEERKDSRSSGVAPLR